MTRNLCVLLDSKLTFLITDISPLKRRSYVTKANRMTGLLISCCMTGIVLGYVKLERIPAAYFGNIWALLEYIICSVAPKNATRASRWNSNYISHLASLSRTLLSGYLSYSNLLSRFKVSSLANRRVQCDGSIRPRQKFWQNVLTAPIY